MSQAILVVPSTDGLPTGLSPAAWRSIVEEGAAPWNHALATCPNARFVVGNPEWVFAAKEDGRNTVVIRNGEWCHNERCGLGRTYPVGSVGETTTYPECAWGARVREADIELNGRLLIDRGGAETFDRWGFHSLRGERWVTLAAAVTHELGHGLGLRDSFLWHPAESDCLGRHPMYSLELP